jgi:nitrate reductase molybdenum cofactor assembly chaperone NarJ/NarW
MAQTFKALSALLSYPSEELQDAADEVGDLISGEKLVTRRNCAALEPLLGSLKAMDLIDLQERYVDLFDKTRRLSLYLFEHVHGEGRDRGQAMVDLAGLYEQGGLTLAAHELPDYLPLFLEYLSTRPTAEACRFLADTLPILTVIEERLNSRHSPYAAVFTALRGVAGDRTAPSAAVEKESAEDDLAALDAAWEETAVIFGPGDGLSSCGVERLKTQIRAGQRDPRRAGA